MTAAAPVHGFEDASVPGLRLRLRPAPSAGAPVIVFLHGGAEAGTDNVAQLTGTFGVLELARRFPDHLVLAPQAPPSTAPLMSPGAPFSTRILDPDSGWNREVLGRVVTVLDGLVASGDVDPTRIRLTGVSMGGAGVIRLLDVAPDMFAGAAPVCPTMTPETFELLRGHRRQRLWLSTGYVDHTPDRHKWITDAVLELVRTGATDVHLTLFSPEQFAEVGIPSSPGLAFDDLLRENHSAWELTYRGSEGILDWLTTRRKDPR